MNDKPYRNFETIQDYIEFYSINYSDRWRTEFNNIQISHAVDDLIRVLLSYEEHGNKVDKMLEGYRVSKLHCVFRALYNADKEISSNSGKVSQEGLVDGESIQPVIFDFDDS